MLFPDIKKSYFEYSISYRNKLIKNIEKIFFILSNGNILNFIKLLCLTTTFGKKYILPASQEIQNRTTLINIKNLYEKALLYQKPSILSLIACDYSLETLKNIGFNISRNQYQRAKKINKNNLATIIPYKRKIPNSKKKLSNETIKKIVILLLNYSNISSNYNLKRKNYIDFNIKN